MTALDRKITNAARVAERWFHLTKPREIAKHIADSNVLSAAEAEQIAKAQIARLIALIMQARERGFHTAAEIETAVLADPRFRKSFSAEWDDEHRTVIRKITEILP